LCDVPTPPALRQTTSARGETGFVAPRSASRGGETRLRGGEKPAGGCETTLLAVTPTRGFLRRASHPAHSVDVLRSLASLPLAAAALVVCGGQARTSAKEPGDGGQEASLDASLDEGASDAPTTPTSDASPGNGCTATVVPVTGICISVNETCGAGALADYSAACSCNPSTQYGVCVCLKMMNGTSGRPVNAPFSGCPQCPTAADALDLCGFPPTSVVPLPDGG
jgi:hypothetical protein